MTEEIKPCPFCGSIDVRWYQSEWDFGCVECGNCNARGPTVDGYNQEQTEDESIEKWNTRKYEIENFHACIGELVSEMDRLRAQQDFLRQQFDKMAKVNAVDRIESGKHLE